MTTKPGIRQTLLATGVALLFVACAGAATSAPSVAPGAATAQPATGTDAPTDAGNAAPTEPLAGSTGGGGVSAEPACALVTKADVATAVGFPIATVTGGGGTCFFQNAEPSQYLSVQLMTDQAGMTLPLELESTGLHVAGLGDDAFWLGDTGMMFVRKGDRAILILNPAWVMTPPTDTAHLDAMTILARSALPNL